MDAWEDRTISDHRLLTPDQEASRQRTRTEAKNNLQSCSSSGSKLVDGQAVCFSKL